ncbi:MAG: thiol:disulfide interchange protein, partial [Muribaculaceae bacterium]|nr:thiol:disulfide interchange protein [Muribaculaceae bacterium]
MPIRLFHFLLAMLIAAAGVSAQIFNPARWTSDIEMTGDNTGVIVFKATIQKGWHVYSNDISPDAGPTPLSIKYTTLEGVTLDGGLNPSAKPHSEYDELFEAQLSWWAGSVELRQKFTATASDFSIDGTLTYAACNDENCIPPAKYPFTLKGHATVKAASVSSETAAAAPVAPAVVEEPVAVTVGDETPEQPGTPDAAVVDTADTAAVESTATTALDLWAPVDYDSTDGANGNGTSMWLIFLTCFLGGFVALLTPCVWPMIPMTVSFFLKKGKSRSKSIADATIYGVSIIVIYVALGLIVTAIFGASALNALSTSAVCNIIFFLLLVVFAISFFG